jgi:hypothetical protein
MTRYRTKPEPLSKEAIKAAFERIQKQLNLPDEQPLEIDWESYSPPPPPCSGGSLRVILVPPCRIWG